MSGKAVHPDHGDFFAALGRRIKELRKERGWSLHDMVVKHGYYVSQWQKYEKGCSVTVDSLLRMATVFGIRLGELIDSLGEFPTKDPDTVATNPAQPKASETTVKRKPAKKAGGRQSMTKARKLRKVALAA